jgi:hypothetical protein
MYAPISTLSDSLEERLGKPNSEPIFIVVELLLPFLVG